MSPHVESRSAFHQKKSWIIEQLSTPISEYDDRSPKGSVDENILQLIIDINQLDGLVTTSSCAGRISVFVEGSKESPVCMDRDVEDTAEVAASQTNPDGLKQPSSKPATPGGKGGGGRWLYVSHDPTCEVKRESSDYFSELFGLLPEEGSEGVTLDSATRYVHFKFEAMILHILTASSHDAQLVMSAALCAGFRESGIRNVLPHSRNDGPMPHVAVRGMGLSLDCIIGYLDGQDSVRSLVDERHLQTLVGIANGRFEENSRRTAAFRAELFRLHLEDQSKSSNTVAFVWEDAQSRRIRKRAEGLQRRQELLNQQPLSGGEQQPQSTAAYAGIDDLDII